MALSATLVITNNTGAPLGFVGASPVNDDATFTVTPSLPATIQNGQSVTILMSNDSVPPFVRGVGCNVTFMNSSFQVGGVYLEIPAIGQHQLWGNNPTGQNVYKYAFANPGDDNSYIATVTSAQ